MGLPSSSNTCKLAAAALLPHLHRFQRPRPRAVGSQLCSARSCSSLPFFCASPCTPSVASLLCYSPRGSSTALASRAFLIVLLGPLLPTSARLTSCRHRPLGAGAAVDSREGSVQRALTAARRSAHSRSRGTGPPSAPSWNVPHRSHPCSWCTYTAPSTATRASSRPRRSATIPWRGTFRKSPSSVALGRAFTARMGCTCPTFLE
mmetsp:Transcript_40436/g.121832  ORF Transcript_40436/g.121832 Transcript_40436/m.121832 type:complete len:205 (+) Transcript_40436:135-749(+)